MNKRKRVAARKHRRHRQKLKLKRRLGAAPGGPAAGGRAAR